MTYVMSDIHGNLRRFTSVLEQIRLQPEDTLYVLGDVIDRHPDGIMILRFLMQASNVKMLLGNHEYMMLDALGSSYEEDCKSWRSQEGKLELWYDNGGRVTHEAFLCLGKDAQEEIIRYLKSLPVNLDIQVGEKKYRLVHASPIEGYTEDDDFHPSAAHYAVWQRLRRYDVNPLEETLIFGHSATKHYQRSNPMKIYHGMNMIGIDCGSGYPEPEAYYWPQGRLACLRLEDMEEFYSDESVEGENENA